MKSIKSTLVIALFVTSVVAIVQPPAARADLFGGDVAVLTSILTETLLQGASLKSQLENLQTQVRYAEQNLRRLDGRSFQGLLDSFNTLKWSYESLKYQTDAIGLTARTVQRDFDRLFPSNKRGWQSVPSSQFDGYFTTWQAQISNSAGIAMSAQTQIELLKRQNDTMVQILRQSQGATGALEQLQLINQSLAKIHDRLGTLVEVLATGQRVTASLAASGANESLMTREAQIRRIDGYTNRGAPSRVLKKLP